jgi:hypothetical protein
MAEDGKEKAAHSDTAEKIIRAVYNGTRILLIGTCASFLRVSAGCVDTLLDARALPSVFVSGIEEKKTASSRFLIAIPALPGDQLNNHGVILRRPGTYQRSSFSLLKACRKSCCFAHPFPRDTRALFHLPKVKSFDHAPDSRRAHGPWGWKLCQEIPSDW